MSRTPIGNNPAYDPNNPAEFSLRNQPEAYYTPRQNELINNYNPQLGRINCVSCVASCLLHNVAGKYMSPQQLDHQYSITTAVGGIKPVEVANIAIVKIREATGLVPVRSLLGRDFRDPRELQTLEVGQYAIFDIEAGHVVYGFKYSPTSLEIDYVFDPQSATDTSVRRYPLNSLAVLFDELGS